MWRRLTEKLTSLAVHYQYSSRSILLRAKFSRAVYSANLPNFNWLLDGMNALIAISLALFIQPRLSVNLMISLLSRRDAIKFVESFNSPVCSGSELAKSSWGVAVRQKFQVDDTYCAF